MKRVIITGSPRADGRSAHIAEMLFEANIDERPEDELFLIPVSEIEVGPCVGCNACRKTMPVIFKNDAGDEVAEERHRCVFDDDMQTLYDLIDEADEITVVSPVYFSGAPAPLKCLLDRLQPYFWRRLEQRQTGALPPKRPLTLHVLGEGGDPHGYDALVSEVKSAFATADFRLLAIYDWVGKVSAQGEITAEAEIREIAKLDAAPGEPQPAEPTKPAQPAQSAKKQRPKLDLSSGGKPTPKPQKAKPKNAKGKPRG